LILGGYDKEDKYVTPKWLVNSKVKLGLFPHYFPGWESLDCMQAYIIMWNKSENIIKLLNIFRIPIKFNKEKAQEFWK